MQLIEYIDTIQATINILRDWRDQQHKAETGKDRITAIDERMISLNSRLGSTPVEGGGTKSQEALCAQIDRKALAKMGYERAKEYLAELEPCWERLTEDERYMLTARFVDPPYGGGGIGRIMEKYNVEKTKAYDMSNAALKRLSKLIFW